MKFKKILSLLLVCIMVFSTISMIASCSDETDSTSATSANNATNTTGSTTGGNDSTNPSSNPDDDGTDTSTVPSIPGGEGTDTSTTPSTNGGSGGNDDGGDTPSGQSSYVIHIFDKNTNKGLAGVNVFLQAEASEDAIMYARGKTDENGFVTLKAEAKYAKYVYVDGIPTGYAHESFYELGATGVEIGLKTSIIPNEDNDFSRIQLGLGDVMYDFTLNTFSYNPETGSFESKQITLSQLFADGKKAVMFNFWYTTCSWCVKEFPHIQAAYELYGEDLEIIGIDAFGDTEDEIKRFIKSFHSSDGCALTFPMAVDTVGLQNAFGFTVNPCSVIIDRYGVVSLVQSGAVIGERYFTNAFEHYVASNYEQSLYSSMYELSPLSKPDVEMSTEEDIKNAIVVGDMNVTFKPETEGEDAEYSWPFVVETVDGKTCIASTNIDRDNSWSIIYANVELKKGQAFMFDYYASTQRMYDVLYVLVNGKDIYTISGRPMEDDKGNLLEDPWKSCCPWVAERDGIYEIAFCYIKDESEKEGDDRVYLDNFRVVDEKDVEIETYIPRDAATDKKLDNSFENYVSIVYNENDGYYHVGTVDGPILLAGLLDVNTPFTDKLPDNMRYTVTIKLTETHEFIVDGKDVYTPFIMYCNYASNAKPHGYCPVTKELRRYLEAFVEQNSFITNENTWLELCAYYDAYGTDSQLEDPIKGLAQFSAFDTIVTEEGEQGFKNAVTYTQIIMPRGYLFKFVPTKSGVYRITSNSTQEVNGWVFTGTYEQWMYENGGDRILYIDSETGERYCPELLVDPDGDGTYSRDFNNCSMIAYFEAGVEYYIDIAYYDVYAAGTFTFDVKYVGESFDLFEEASKGPFTYSEIIGDEIVGDIIAGGINVALCKDENDPRYGYYCHLLPNGTLGSIVYADFHYTTNIFPSSSLTALIEQGAFNMFMTEIDRQAYVYVKNYYEVDGLKALKDLWGEDFDANWELYQMDDAIQGIYHGEGPDYTETVKKYIDMLEDGTDGEGNLIYPERQGCVPVTEELATILQALMDKFTFKNVDHSWTKLCYYYKSLEAPLSSEEKMEQLQAMINVEFNSTTTQALIAEVLNNLEASLSTTTNEIVRRGMIDGAMERAYTIIQADKK